MLRVMGTARLSDVLGDFVVYRNLAPVDPRLPGIDAVRAALGLEPHQLPRKAEPAYATVIAELLRRARALDGNAGPIDALVYLGDTRYSDGSAFANLCQALGCPGLGFIAAETAEPARLHEEAGAATARLLLANRWSLLAELEARMAAAGVAVGPNTALVVDLDKTALGARGRNDAVIDQARASALAATIAATLGNHLDDGAWRRAYDLLNRPRYHPFTADNQDNLAYLCLLIAGGAIDLDWLTAGVASGELPDLGALLAHVDALPALEPALAAVHSSFREAFSAGDPTPFKTFRRHEYVETVQRMQPAADAVALEEVLARHITVTAEVYRLCREWRARGAILCGLSDKPDEASLPDARLAAAGFEPLHRTTALLVGEPA